MKLKTTAILAIAMLAAASQFKSLAQSQNISRYSGTSNETGNASIERALDELKNENKKLNEKNAALENRLNQVEKDLSQCCMSYKLSVVSHQPPVENLNGLPRLEQNTPNPFKEKTVIKYYVPTNAASAFIKIYSFFGSELLSFPLAAKGFNQIEFSGKTLSAGIFAYILFVDGKAVDTKQMVLTK
jgi:hypothetical protein